MSTKKYTHEEEGKIIKYYLDAWERGDTKVGWTVMNSNLFPSGE